MKKIILIFCFILLIFPLYVYAKSSLGDIEPKVNIEGIDKDHYNIEKEINDKEIIVGVFEKDGKLAYSWKFFKNQLKKSTIDLDFEISYESQNEEIIDSLSKENKDKMYISFTQHGDLPSEAEISIYVGNKYKENDQLYLYYYNPKKKEIEFVENKIKVTDGYVKFHINHCSDYFLTRSIVSNAVGNPKVLNNVIAVLVLFVFALTGTMLFSKK